MREKSLITMSPMVITFFVRITGIARSNSATSLVSRLSMASVYTDATEGDLRSVHSSRYSPGHQYHHYHGHNVPPLSCTPPQATSGFGGMSSPTRRLQHHQQCNAASPSSSRFPVPTAAGAMGVPIDGSSNMISLTPGHRHMSSHPPSEHGSVNSYATRFSTGMASTTTAGGVVSGVGGGASSHMALPRCPHVGGKRNSSRVFVPSAGEHVALDSKYKPGFGLLELRSHCSFLPHLAFSLLHGRPVVVFATKANEDNVRKLIRTLWLFVPGRLQDHMGYDSIECTVLSECIAYVFPSLSLSVSFALSCSLLTLRARLHVYRRAHSAGESDFLAAIYTTAVGRTQSD